MSSVEKLRERREELLLQREIATLEAETRSAEILSKHVVEAWGDSVSRTEFLRDGSGLSNFGFGRTDRVSRAQDKRQGDNYPHWRTEVELAQIRGESRHIATSDEVAISALENLGNYCLGSGLEWRVIPKRQHANNPQAKEAARAAQQIIDRFLDDNGWQDGAERGAFERWRRDGEIHVALYDEDDGRRIDAKIIDPDFVTEPERPRQLEDYLDLPSGLCWKYGHASDWKSPGTAIGYFVSWFGDPVDWEYLPAERVVHSKLNVDEEVKRGLSDFYSVRLNLEKAGKLLENTLIGASIQASIAYIREHAEGTTAEGIRSFVKARADSTQTVNTESGSRTRYGRRMDPGTVVDIKQGAKYHAGPLGQPRSTSYIDLVQAALRLVGVRWQMPEYLISGDASNGNFASVLVAEAPFTKSSERKQRDFAATCKRIAWKVLRIASRFGLLPPWSRLREWLEVTVEGPEIAVRDRVEDHQIRREENEAGILSEDTWASLAGYDLADERAKGAKRRSAEPPQTPQGGTGDRSESENEGGGDPEPELPDNLKTTVSLNGAQIAAVMDVLAQLRAGDVAEPVAVSMMTAVGVESSEAESIVAQQAAHNRAHPPREPAPTISESWRGYP